MTIQQMLQEIQEKIADKTLSKGCRINKYRDSYRGNEEENLIVVSLDPDILICFNGTRYWQSCGSEGTTIIPKDDIDNDCYEVIGHPISLSRVLSALGKEYRVQRSEERIDYALKMGLVRKDAVGSTDGDTINISWELLNQENSDAMLDNQSPETIKAIWEIVCK